MKNPWLWIALLLVAFNLVLAFTYFGERKKIERAFSEMTSSPGVEEYSYRSQHVLQGFRMSLSNQKDLSMKFAKVSEDLTRAINALAPSEFKGDKISFFEKRFLLTDAQQDSLWLAYRSYRESIDKILLSVLPERHDYYQRYLGVSAIDRELNKEVTKERKKILQTSLDSLSNFSFATYKIDMGDRRRLGEFISFMHLRSDPAEELKLNNLVTKMDDCFPAKGKMVLYGKVVELNSVTEAERRQLFNFSVLIKSEVDEHLFRLVR